MTRTPFREFLHWFDDHLKDRKVVLLLDTPLAQRFVSLIPSHKILEALALQTLLLYGYQHPGWTHTINSGKK
jgi:hypothetical protein